MNKFYLLLLVLMIYWQLVIILDRRGILKKYNISAYGPILMIRTTKGQAFLDKLALHKRFWRIFADIGLPAMLIGMLAMFILLLFVDYSMLSSFQTETVPHPGKFNEPRNIFLIPGINEYIPLGVGIIALIITLVVHEFSHAVLCKVEGIRVKSMGILLAIVPIGGFAEPDEEQLLGKKEDKKEKEEVVEGEESEPKKLATPKERVRILTAGVMANFVTALVAFVLFFSLLGSLSPVGEVMVTEVLPGYPAEGAGVKPNMILTGINDQKINSAHDFIFYTRTLEPGSKVNMHFIENGVKKEISLITSESNQTLSGVQIFDVVEGSPAEAAGLKPGMILVRIDDTEIKGLGDFISFMNSTHMGQIVDIYLLQNTSSNATLQVFKNVELAKYPYAENSKKGFMGVTYSPEDSALVYSLGIGIGQFPAKNYLEMLKNIPSLLTGLTGWILLFSLPIFGLAGEGFPGFSGQIGNFYEPTGLAVILGTGIFMILNVLLWIGWMNFYVGLFNCLPAVPLDGGHVFRDVITSSLTRVIGNGKKVERLANTIVVIFAVLILMSFIFVIIAPYAAHGF